MYVYIYIDVCVCVCVCHDSIKSRSLCVNFSSTCDIFHGSWHTYHWVMAHIMSHVTYINYSCRTCQGVMIRKYQLLVHMWCDLLICEPWIIRTCAVSRSADVKGQSAWHDSSIYVPCLRVVSISHDTRINESWPKYQWVMAHMSMRHGALVNESWHACQ